MHVHAKECKYNSELPWAGLHVTYSPRSSSHFPFSSIHHCYYHSPTKDCSQQDTSNEATEGSTYTHTRGITCVRIGGEVVSSKVIISHVNRQILYTTHDTSSLLRDIMFHYYIIVVGCSGPWTEERNLRSQNQFYVMISSCEG